MPAVQALVESVGVERVDAERADRRRHPAPVERHPQPEQLQLRRRAVPVGPVPVPAVLADEPAEVARSGRRRPAPPGASRARATGAAQRTSPVPRTPADLATRRDPRQAEHDERDEERQCRPLHRAGGAEHHAGEQPPRPRAERGHAAAELGAVGDQPPSRPRILSRSTTSAVNPASTNSSKKMSSSAVRDSTSDMPSSASSRPANAAEQVRPDHPPREACHQHDAEHAGDRRRHPPAQRRVRRQTEERQPISHFPSGGCTMNM